MSRPHAGQRWISTSEPVLGLGVVRAVEHHVVEIFYPAAEESRAYAIETAPIVRVVFSAGDEISDREGAVMVVEKTTIRNQILTYHAGERRIPEGELADSLNFIRPEKRLFAALVDHPRDFDHRVQALEWDTRVRQNSARGFMGARIDLIPHQLAIVSEVANRLHPRVLLADEVGLGKTIEACLILHRLSLTGRAGRILILVPEPLVHQWFVELLRRFNLLFALFDEDRCAAIEAHNPEANPFHDSQLILAATDFLTKDLRRCEQAREGDFDLLVVDEAHHLAWSPDDVSAAYAAVESLARMIPSLLLLTATPQQLGPAGHFARLRLLDPERYADLDAFLAESASYAPLAAVVEGLKAGGLPGGVEGFAARSPRAAGHLRDLRGGDEAAGRLLVSELIDSFGTGRVLFRNTREQLTGFPERRPHLHALEEGESPYRWLADLIRSLPEGEKILLITGSPEAAVAVQEKLLGEIQIESALFHEDLSLIQRDRNAAWFADPEGARILMCSEIGSEGRNFQFARHLVLFGLPRDPELLEQRIGRLDRIGQTGTIHIHVPYGVGSRSEMQARWLHEGLDAFTRPLKGATTLATELLPVLEEVEDIAELPLLIERSREMKRQVALELSTGHDRLLELGAPAAEKATALLGSIRSADGDLRFERFAIRLFDHLGLDVSDLFKRSYHFHRGQRHSEVFADLPEDGLSATFDRAVALAREDLTFMTADNPVFLSALEQLLESQSGNASFAQWKAGTGKGMVLECVFVLEVIAPRRLHLDRFLAPTALRVFVDHHGNATSGPAPAALTAGDPRPIVSQETFRQKLFPLMLESARKLAESAAAGPAADARKLAGDALEAEIRRLRDLASRNPQVSMAEIEALVAVAEETDKALGGGRVRLDALKLIWKS